MSIIHVGKCGGSSLSEFLKSLKINYRFIHMKYVPLNTSKNIVTMRCPVRRVVSVFKFWKMVEQNPKHVHYKGQHLKDLDINDFFENIEKYKHIFDNLQHFKQSLSFYIKPNDVSKITHVLRQEHYDSDFLKVFGKSISTNKKIHNTEHISVPDLTEKSILNIKNMYKKDYEIIELLLQHGKIDKEYVDTFV